MAEENQKREFKGIWIPKEIWLNNNLIMMEKIVLAELDSFETENGCFASNAYLGAIVNISSSRISQIISKLKKMNLIKVKLIYKPHSKEIDRRIVKVNKREIYK